MTFATGFGFQRDYSLYPGTGLEGMIDDSIPHDVVTLSNNATSKAQVSRITIGTPASNTKYTVIISSTKLGIDSTTVEYTSGAGASISEIQSGLINAINSSPRLAGYFRLTKDATDILVAGRIAGTAGEFTLAVSGGGTGFSASVETSAADPSVIQFGRLLWQRTSDTGRNCRVARPRELRPSF